MVVRRVGNVPEDVVPGHVRRVLLPFFDGYGGDITDISGGYHNVATTASPTWGTMGQLGKLTFNGTTQYVNSLNNTRMDGERTVVVVVSPNFAENEDVIRTIFKLETPGGGEFFTISKRNNGSGNVIWFLTDGKTAGAATGFSSGDKMVLIATLSASTGAGVLYYNGLPIGTMAAAPALSSTFSNLWIGSSGSGVEPWKGDISLFASLPRLMDAQEAYDVSQSLLRLAGRSYITKNSGASIGTAAQQTIAHGLSFTPTKQQIGIFSDNFTGVAAQTASPDATNIYVTSTNNSAWHWATVGN